MNTTHPWPHAEYPVARHPSLREVQEYLYRYGLTGPHEEVHEAPAVGGGAPLRTSCRGYEAARCARCGGAFVRAIATQPRLCGKAGCE